MSSRGGDRCKIYVGHLNPRTSERTLRHLFERYGRILKIDLKHRYAFIDFNDRRTAEDAVYAMNGRDIEGERIVVEWTRGIYRGRGRGYRPERSDYRVIIDNLPDNSHWQDLKDEFRRAGDVIYGDINGNTGVVEFRYPEDVTRAIKTFDRTRWNGSTIYVEEDHTRRFRSNRRRRSRSDSHSRSRSRTPRSRSRSRSRSPRPSSRRKHRSKSVSRSRSKSPAKSRSRSPRGGRSGSRSQSRSRSGSGKRRSSRSPPPTTSSPGRSGSNPRHPPQVEKIKKDEEGNSQNGETEQLVQQPQIKEDSVRDNGEA